VLCTKDLNAAAGPWAGSFAAMAKRSNSEASSWSPALRAASARSCKSLMPVSGLTCKADKICPVVFNVPCCCSLLMPSMNGRKALDCSGDSKDAYFAASRMVGFGLAKKRACSCAANCACCCC